MWRHIERFLVKLNGIIVASMLFVMFLLVFSNVVTRYVFGFSMNWAEEISRYLMIATTYLGAGLAMREGRHAAIEALQDLLPRPVQPYFRAFVGLIIIGFMGILTYLGYRYAMFAMNHKTAVLRIPLGWIIMSIPVGALAFILHLASIFQEYMHKPSLEDDETSEVPQDKGVIQA